MKRYNIYYTKYNFFVHDYVPYIKVVETDDIYHEVGKLICKSIEKIDNIRYIESYVTLEACEKLWLESGYRKLSRDTWVKDLSFEKGGAE